MTNDTETHIAQIANYIQTQGLQPTLIESLKEALIYPGNDRPALVARIPVICNDIREIRRDIWWVKWLVMGMVGGIGAIFISIVIFTIVGKIHGV